MNDDIKRIGNISVFIKDFETQEVKQSYQGSLIQEADGSIKCGPSGAENFYLEVNIEFYDEKHSVKQLNIESKVFYKKVYKTKWRIVKPDEGRSD
jgi:hypothetical protein